MYDYTFIDAFIKCDVHEGSPFNNRVTINHPNCNAGTTPTNCAILALYSLNELKYKMANYNFEDIRTALEYGPGYDEPIIIGPNSMIDPSISFPKTYNGAVCAMQFLINDLGTAMNTNYQPENSYTDISSAHSIMHNIGCEVSPLYYSFNFQTMWELLCTKHGIIQNVTELSTNKTFSIIIQGIQTFTKYPGDAGISGMVCAYISDYNYTKDIDLSTEKSCTSRSHYQYYFDLLITNYNPDFRLGSFFGVKVNW